MLYNVVDAYDGFIIDSNLTHENALRMAAFYTERDAREGRRIKVTYAVVPAC